MIIELFGLPASGKTTLAKQLEKRGFTVIKIKNRWELVFYNGLFLLAHPIKFVVNFLYLIVNSSTWYLFYYKFMNCFLGHNAKYTKAQFYQRAILDQGHFQNILSVFDKPLNRQNILSQVKFLPRPDHLLILDLKPELWQKRVTDRGYFARESFSQDYQQKWQKSVIANYRLFISLLTELKLDYNFITVDLNDDQTWQQIPSSLKSFF